MSETPKKEQGKEEGTGEEQAPLVNAEVLQSEGQKEITQEEVTQIQEKDAVVLQELREQLGLEEQDIAELRSELKDVFDPNFMTLGHGTKLEVADAILQSGIRTTESKGSWDMIGVQLDSSAESLKQILHWTHKEANAIVIIMVPNKPENIELTIRDYLNAIFEEDESQGYKLLRIPPKYLRGYINVQTKKFVANPLFNPDIPSITTKGIARIGKRDFAGEVPIPSGEGEGEKKNDDVW